MNEPDAFEQFALEYDTWFEDHDREYALELDAIRRLLPRNGSGIEVGAGTGRFTGPLEIALGIEPSEAMRNVALGRGANVIEGTAESLPVEDHSYDFALLVTTVCFLDRPELAFKEVYRVLGSKGSIIVGLIDKDSHMGRKYEKKKDRSKFYKNARFHSVDEIQDKLERSGFSHIECVQAILPGDIDGNYTPEVKQGYGEGSFVVLRAQKGDT